MLRATLTARAMPQTAKAAGVMTGNNGVGVRPEMLGSNVPESVFNTPLNVDVEILRPVQQKRQPRQVRFEMAVQSVREEEKEYQPWAGWVVPYRLEGVALGSAKVLHSFELMVPVEEVKQTVVPRRGDKISVLSRSTRVTSWRPLRSDELAKTEARVELRKVVFNAVLESAMGSNLSVKERLDAYKWGLDFALAEDAL